MTTTTKNLLAAAIMWLLIALCASVANAQFNADSTTYTYKGASYEVAIGSRGGKYIMVDGEKYYPSSGTSTLSAPADAKTIVYNGVTYTILVGPKGGRYIMVGDKKKYIKTI